MIKQEFDRNYRKKLEELSTTNLSDAMDKLGLRGAIIGIRPLFDAPKVVGRAMTVKITAAGIIKSQHHLGIRAIDEAEKGDVIVIDNGGDCNNNCWGEILSYAAKRKGISGVVIDGAARDIDECEKINFPVYARGVVPITARGRIMEENYNCLIRIGDVQVRPGDIVVADVNGVVVIPQERVDDGIKTAQEIFDKEEKMIADISQGMSIIEVDKKYSYEQMLKNEDK